jgi:hypothetical protein
LGPLLSLPLEADGGMEEELDPSSPSLPRQHVYWEPRRRRWQRLLNLRFVQGGSLADELEKNGAARYSAETIDISSAMGGSLPRRRS